MSLLQNTKQWLIFILGMFFIFSIQSLFLYHEYIDFKNSKIYRFSGEIINIYDKNDYNVLKIKDENIEFFTSIDKYNNIKKLNSLNGYILTSKITFIDYVKGFYANSFGLDIKADDSFKALLHKNINLQHQNKYIADLFSALFLAIPLGDMVRHICAVLGISHLIALSGFHLGLLSSIIYFLLYYPYSYLHQIYIPYRNKRADLLYITIILLLGYLLFTNVPPSLLRAFVMMAFGIYFVLTGIKIVNYQTLFIIVLWIVALFPNMLFSLSFWFSVCGVFYIFLFLQYFGKLPKSIQLLIFNFWIYFMMNAVVHYFFDTVSFVQLFSPFLTLGFTVFYPIELLMHLLGQGGYFDGILEFVFEYEFHISSYITPLWFFLLYLGLSFYAIINRYVFYVLNSVMIIFNSYMFVLL